MVQTLAHMGLSGSLGRSLTPTVHQVHHNAALLMGGTIAAGAFVGGVAATPVVGGYVAGGALSFLPGVDAAVAGYFARKKIYPNVVKGIATVGIPASLYNLYKFGPVIIDKIQSEFEPESRGDQGGRLPSTPGVAKPGSIGSPSAPRIGARSTGRGVPSSRRGRASRTPYCRVHKKRHWCKFTKR